MEAPIKFYSNFSLNNEDIRTINLLYLPLIGFESTTLYSFLHTILNKVTLESEIIDKPNLVNLLGLKVNTFNQALAKLEGINLARTFTSADLTIVILLPPFTPKNFLKDTILGSYLYQIVGENWFNKLVKQFSIPPLDLKDYKEITRTFGEVFKEEINENYFKVDENISGRRPNHRNLTSNSDFDMDLFLSKIDITNLKDGITDDFKKKITSICFVYNFSLEQMTNLFYDSIKDDGYFSYDILKKKAQSLYNFLHKFKEPVKNNSKEEKIAEALDNLKPEALLESLIGENFPTILLQKINELYNNINLSPGLINLMIIKIYASKKSIPALSYFEKVAKSWQDNGIFTTYDAIVKNVYKENKPKRKNKVDDIKLEDWQIEGMEEIMKGFKNNG